MKTSEIKLFLIEVFTLIILIINAFFISIFNLYTLSIFLLFMLIITVLLVGFEREKITNKKRNIKIILTFTICLLIIKYGLGLLSGFLYSPYSKSLVGIFRNVFPVLLLVIVSEVFRYDIIVKSSKNKILFVGSVLIFTLSYLNITNDLTNITSLKRTVELVSTDILMVLFENIALSFLSRNYGYSGALSYSLVMNLYIYFVPIVPGLGEYLEAAVMIGFPIVTLIFSNYLLEAMKKEDFDPRDKHIFAKLIRFALVMGIIVLVALNSNLFRYWIAVIASGSMEPTIKVGDIIIVDKSYKDRIDEIQEGDVLVFGMNGKIYTHRVIKVNVKGDEYSFVTKGDRENQSIDSWVVTKNEVIGVTRHTLKGLGLPAIWLKNAIERE